MSYRSVTKLIIVVKQRAKPVGQLGKQCSDGLSWWQSGDSIPSFLMFILFSISLARLFSQETRRMCQTWRVLLQGNATDTLHCTVYLTAQCWCWHPFLTCLFLYYYTAAFLPIKIVDAHDYALGKRLFTWNTCCTRGKRVCNRWLYRGKFLFVYLRLYNMAARVGWRGGGEEEIYHDHASRKQKGTGEKRQNESRDFQRCVHV